jgi:hypothetical protein
LFFISELIKKKSRNRGVVNWLEDKDETFLISLSALNVRRKLKKGISKLPKLKKEKKKLGRWLLQLQKKDSMIESFQSTQMSLSKWGQNTRRVRAKMEKLDTIY